MHTFIKSILPKGLILKGLDILVAVLAIIALSYEISDYFLSEFVILELEELETPFTYSLTGADSDQNYLLEYVKIYPYFDHPVKLATFKYDHYVEKLDLKISQKEQPQAYFVSKEFLENEFGKQGFQFEFLDDNRLTFHFQFDAGEQNKPPDFECKIGIVDNSVPCKVVEKSLISSWYYTMGLSVFILIAIVVFWLPIRLLIWQKTKEYGYNKARGYG
ncbi:MAG: hypothetical protein DRR16_24710 [Candidatus Parabeggiatoa sp. nov. 3]|nr:MAG: hypothetical protein DRR00_21700 [Gammaproteobacteria bacterium]RKZ64114.1 MAG: hypothetical protein DRQ99_16005 [Gammaproteobacteria bacterium]RKZ79989.1 MAG: hypothetical protein DRR16_24710 [Gammaproteobacteria bacterium]